jgi:chromosome segregation ATPase
MSEVYKKLRALEGGGENSTTEKSVPQKSALAELDGEAGGFRDEADQLRQTISTLEAEWEALNQERTDLQGLLEELTGRLEVLSQEVAARDKRLEEIDRSHTPMVEELRAEIQEKAGRIASLEKEIENLKGAHQQKTEGMEQEMADRGREVESVRTEAGQLHQTISTLEAKQEVYQQERVDLKGLIQEWSSRLEVLSQKVTGRGKSVEKGQSSKEVLVLEDLTKESGDEERLFGIEPGPKQGDKGNG